ncbi:MAG: oligosaccharide flippase family protein [Chloroflexi bacterium]|nr:oligosaccharide flippase family protein [Chloroflexota bacterium]
MKLKDEFLQQASVVFVVTMLANLLNYLYQLFMGRALGTEDFGVFGALFAVFYFLSLIVGTVQTTTARYVSIATADIDSQQLSPLLRGSLKRMALMGILIFATIVLGSGYIAAALKIGSALPVVIVGAIFVLAPMRHVFVGVLQGLQRYGHLTLNGAVYSAARLLLGALLVYLGFGVSGALAAIVLAGALALVVAVWPCRALLGGHREYKYDFAPMYRYAPQAMLAILCFSVSGNIDIIVAKLFFSSYDTGLYNAAAVLGKIILFIPGAFNLVMFPKVSKAHAQHKSKVALLAKSLLFTAIVSGAATAVLFVMPQIVLNIFLGPAYLEATELVGWYGLSMLFLSFVVVFVHYHLAFGHITYIYFVALFILAEIFLLLFFHSSLVQMVQVLVVVNAGLFLASCLYVLVSEFSQAVASKE